MKEGVSAKILSGARAAENSLAREEMRELEESLPEGHPLHDEIEKKKAEMGGDLSGLPPGHPLYRMLRDAKARYDEDIAEETEEAQAKAREVKKAKKVDREKARRERIAREEEQSDKRRTAASAVNKEIANTLESVKSLYEALAEHEEIFNMEPISRARSLRLKRLLYALERGLSESRLGRA